MSKTYVHYGDTEFRPELLTGNVKHMMIANKPGNSLWASPEDAAYSWKDWNASEHYAPCTEDNAFRFVLSDDANILTIETHEEAAQFYEKYCELSRVPERFIVAPVDFQKMKADGIDGLEVKLPVINQYFYCWDCESIAVWNPDVIIPLSPFEEVKENV